VLILGAPDLAANVKGPPTGPETPHLAGPEALATLAPNRRNPMTLKRRAPPALLNESDKLS
jgi:hypothetical protein